MRKYLLSLFLICSMAINAQQGEVRNRMSPVMDLGLGGHLFAFGSLGNEWNPAYKVSVAAGLALPTPRAILTARLRLTADAVRTTYDDNTITKRYIVPSLNMEYDYTLTSKWFMGLGVSLGFAHMYDWDVDKPSVTSQKSHRPTLEEELSSMKVSGSLLVTDAQVIVGYSLSEKFKLRTMIHCSMSNFMGNGNGHYSDNRETLLGMSVSIEYKIICN